MSSSLKYLALTAVAIVASGPFIWMTLTAFKTGQNIYTTSFDVADMTFANFTGVWSFLSIPDYIGNTVIITGGSIILDVVLGSLCAYPLACMSFRGKNVIMVLLISAMIIPAAAGMVINYLTLSKLNLLNTLVGVILPGSVKVFSIVLLRQAYLSVPRDLIEAARIDGASELLIWRRIMLPSIMPAISTVVIFDFIGRWNEFLWPVIVLQDPSKYPLAAALQYLNGAFNYRFGYIAAGTVISIIPVLIVFIIFQKNYVNAVAGAVKA
ncbi:MULTISPECIES: carbohydrate ABC transporter permease [unclassified Actinomyces]|uniref:carbohydrate ABC transporter permease n=1 Tax=unclassified Actinomyces TaxID=2609248 RepID=UPI0020171F0E|nr:MULTISPECIES: carbohydrate ABC transporter permease [unclassified Actinomyces]MCL3776609.1 carbohydrate ABC transporter permease [Actinomyces sp. AC-20-1]MCL3790108.1 carbohydrate ABC transporter permease [Actinomyces sp. 187325]MCL3792410.1 carbohydrate ABC transporter permease [Actinomyces sp. 186855]MCL3793475.1 carbohydrate ABC transporter permease [Actinomyces sp. 217892]